MTQRNDRSAALPGVLLVALLVTPACNEASPTARELEQRAATGEEFALAEVTPFDWDRCAILAPYTPRARAEELLLVRWPTFTALGLEGSDSFHLLACSRDGEVTGTVRLRRAIEFADGTADRVLLPGTVLRPVADGDRLVLEAPLRGDPPEFGEVESGEP